MAPKKKAATKTPAKSTAGKSPAKIPAKAANKTVQKTIEKSAAKAVAEPIKKPPVKKPAKLGASIVPPDYNPKKDKEEFMNDIMAEYFRQKLIKWREELLRELSETIHITLQGTELQKPDLADRAAAETDHALELRTRDRERKLISKINEAILRIDEGTYGYCEETGEPISVARLDARPIATLSLEAQERHERLEKTHRDE